ncbi:MAG: alpha/beta hydrolase [Myxococcota bacterium]
MVEPIAIRADIDLAVEQFDGGNEPLVLIMGLGAQMLMWPDAWCAQLADAGFRVIRFDNRDIGLSSQLPHLGRPRLRNLLRFWERTPPPYTLEDLAMDTVLLLDALEIDRAHVVGASMGGMIAQVMAIHHGERIKTLTSIMSTPNLWASGPPKPQAVRALLTPPRDRTPEAAVEQFVNAYRAIESPVHPADPRWLQALAQRCVERGSGDDDGVARQSAAIMAGADRRPGLREVPHPACVIHGALDPLIRPGGGRQTAEALPSAELLVLDEMGHDLPEPLWGELTNALVRTASRAAR